ncbi:MAG: zf-TFIIB domain-containing protein [Xanthomonadales bacterium]|nr:zf-TFIIB domain-containing protein [Xanthomonadales bacterium]
MSLSCPTCASSQLHATALADQLPAESCPDCRGAMLSLIHYRDWRAAHAAPEESVTDAGEASHVNDNKAMLRCPRARVS